MSKQFKNLKIMGLSTGETDIVGGGYPTAFGGGLGGGLGGFGLVGLIGLNSFLGRDGLGAGVAGAAALGAGTTVLEQNVSNIREEIGQLGNEFQTAINASNMNNANNFRALDNRLCESEKSAIIAANAALISGLQNTQSIKDQAANFQVVNQENFCAIKELIHNDGDATRALITTNLIDGLRAELALERRSRDNREIEINVTQTNQQTQNQLQAQIQQQNQFLATMFNSLGDQVNRAANSVVNVGSGSVAGGQTNNQSATKVNS